MMRRNLFRLSLWLMSLAAAPAVASAQSPLSGLSLEDLMALDSGQVFGASERLQPSTEAPASVSFVTRAEIARFGYRTLADILRGVRGMYVSDDRNFSLLGTRGFAKPGDYNSRILLLINGHRVNDNIFGQAEIGAEFGLDVAMIERVEIIRGPASTLYGDSALFAVVNVITRAGASFLVPKVTVEAGTLGTRLVRGSYGQVMRGVDFAVSGTYEESNGYDRIYYPEFNSPETNNGIAEGLDGEGVRQFYGRLGFKGLTLTTMYGTRQREVSTASFGSVFNEQEFPEETTDRHTMIDADYVRMVRGTRLSVRGAYDRYTFDASYPAPEPDSPRPNVLKLAGLGSRVSFTSGITRTFRGGHTLRAGVEVINNLHHDQSANYTDPAFELLDSQRSSKQAAVYAQDEIKVSPWLILNGGLRFDAYGEFQRVSPRAAVIVLPSPSQSFKYLFGNAFRAPNSSELNTTYYGDKVLDLRPESVDTHELVWERYTNDWLRTATSFYWYRAKELITLVADPTTLASVSFVNQGEVRAKGFEAEAQMRLPREVRTLVSYSIQRAAEAATDMELANSPRHLFKARLSVPGPKVGSFVSLEGQYLSRRNTVIGGTVPGATVVNLTVVHPLGRFGELFGTVKNLFDAEYADPASDQHRQESIPQNGRTARIGLRWSFGKN